MSAKTYLLYWVSVLFCPLALFAKAGEPTHAFDRYAEMLLLANEASDLYGYYSASKLEEEKKHSKKEAAQLLKERQDSLRHFESVYKTVRTMGRRAEIRLVGVDTNAVQEAIGTVALVNERGGWKLRSFELELIESSIANKMRVWKLGLDETEMTGILKSDDDAFVYIMKKDMKVVKIPHAQLSEKDIRYLQDLKHDKKTRLQTIRARLAKQMTKGNTVE